MGLYFSHFFGKITMVPEMNRKHTKHMGLIEYGIQGLKIAGKRRRIEGVKLNPPRVQYKDRNKFKKNGENCVKNND